MNALIHTPCGLIYGTAELDQEWVRVTFGTDQEIYNMPFGKMRHYSKGAMVFFDAKEVRVQVV